MSRVNIVNVLIGLLWVSGTLIYFAEIPINNMLATTGATLAKYYEEGDRLKLENALLEKELAMKRSLQWAAQEATKAGFISIQKVEAISE